MLDVAILVGYGRDSLGLRSFSIQLLDKPLLVWVLELLKEISKSPLIIVTSEGHAKAIMRSGIELPRDVSYTIVIDTYITFKKPSSLSGVYTALSSTIHDKVFVTMPNYPLVKASSVKKMLTMMDDYDVVIVKLPSGEIEPLLGIYRKRVSSKLEHLLEAGYDIYQALKELKVKIIPVSDLSNNPELEFTCINSFQDTFRVGRILVTKGLG